MPTILQAGKRLTHKYKDRWAHLDEWDESNPTIIKVLKGKHLHDYQRDERDGKPVSYYDMSDAGTTVFNVVVKKPKGLDKDEVYRALADNMNYGGCSHEHDCCGCGSGSISYSTMRRTGRNEWYVEMWHSRNY